MLVFSWSGKPGELLSRKISDASHVELKLLQVFGKWKIIGLCLKWEAKMRFWIENPEAQIGTCASNFRSKLCKDFKFELGFFKWLYLANALFFSRINFSIDS